MGKDKDEIQLNETITKDRWSFEMQIALLLTIIDKFIDESTYELVYPLLVKFFTSSISHRMLYNVSGKCIRDREWVLQC